MRLLSGKEMCRLLERHGWRLLAVAGVRQRCGAQGVAKLEVGPKAAADGPRWGSGRLLLARASDSADQRLAAAAALLDAVAAGPG